MTDILLLDNQHNLSEGLSGDKFSDIMKLCFSRATAFSLIQRNTLPTYPSYVEERLSPYVIARYRVTQWFAWTGGEYDEILYKATPQTMEIMLCCFNDIFLHNRKNIPKKKHEQIGKTFLYPSFLEDLCFFRKNEMFFGTLSHECICAAKPTDEIFEKLLYETASWKKLPKDCFNMGKIHIK